MPEGTEKDLSIDDEQSEEVAGGADALKDEKLNLDAALQDEAIDTL